MAIEITREHLLAWAETPEAARDLPRLIRRLIIETSAEVASIDFAGGGGVAGGGFDGVVESSSTNAFVPDGMSVWELSVEKSTKRKANGDYAKRTTGPGGADPAQYSYVQVIARPWTKARSWAMEKEADGRWRSVRALNVDNLETWLDQAPATSVWLARRLELPTDGLVAASDWFDTWSAATDPPTTPEIILAGRARVVQQVRDLLAGKPRIITVGGDVHPDEVRAFVAAAIHAPGESGPSTPAIFVDDRVSFEHLVAQRTRSVILVADAAWLPAQLGPQHVFVPVPAASDCDVVVPPVAGEQVAESLAAAGMDRDQARHLGELARRSLLAYRRRLAVQPALHLPAWAEPPVDRIHRRLLLVDRWRDDRDGDHDAVARLVEEDHRSVDDQLTAIAGTGDPMLAVVDRIWHVVSPRDTWHLLAGRLTGRDLEAFRAVAVDVLGERDPSLSLPLDERWLASIRGLRRAYTETLREGLAHTLARLGAYEATVNTGNGMTGQRWADQIVGELLDKANDDASLTGWESLTPSLPLLAEAAPSVFLQAVRQGLSGDEPLLSAMFQDHGSSVSALTATSPHTGLLWSLERVAWSPEYFDTAVSLIAMLAELDPGGRLSNRPRESLASIFCPWRPHTNATEEQRFATLERLRRRFPDVAWTLLLSQLPDGHGFQVGQVPAQYRDWGRDRSPVTRADYLRVTERVASILIGWLPERADGIDLVERAADLSPTQRRSLVTVLIDMARGDGPLTDERRARAWEALRSLVARHREYADAHWSLPEKELSPLLEAMVALEPSGPEARHAWLFEPGLVTLGDLRRRDDHAAYVATLASRRRTAVGEVLEKGGLDAVIEFAKQVAAPREVGRALAEADYPALDEPMANLLDSDHESAIDASHGYFACRFRSGGWEWLDVLLAAPNEWSPTAVARALLASRDPVGGPDRADMADAAVRDVFWREFNWYGLGRLDAAVVDRLARSLLVAGRPAAAVELLASYYPRRVGSDVDTALLVADALDELLASSEDSEIHRLSGYEFEQLFSVLAEHRDAVGHDRVIRIEWALAPALGHQPDLRNIYAAMAREPDLFVELVALQNGDGVVEPAGEGQRRAAENAFRVLSGWKTCPAAQADGRIDKDELRGWVERARAGFEERGLVEVGDREIGKAFAYAVADQEGAWPPAPVRDLMQDHANDDLERGFEIETYNKRGVHWRDPEGGDQERELAARYRSHADAARPTSPQVAAVLDRLAANYEAEAQQHDEEAERRRRGLGL